MAAPVDPLTVAIDLTPRAVDAIAARLLERLRDAPEFAAALVPAGAPPLSCAEFAARLGPAVKPAFVQRLCRQGRIRPIPGTRPYLIPLSEFHRWSQGRKGGKAA